MNEIGQLVKSPAFWFSSVIIAFLMSIFASYTRDWIDSKKVLFSKNRSKKKEDESREFQEIIVKLKNNQALFSVYQSEIIFQKVRNILYYILTYILTMFSFSYALSKEYYPALLFIVLSLLVFSIPVQITRIKAGRIIKIVNAVIDDDRRFFDD